MPSPTQTPTQDRAYDPAGEVVQVCSELIAIDTTNPGDDSGPGERKAAEYVAGLLDEVGIESRIIESEPGRASLVARWGGASSDREDAMLLSVVRARSRAGAVPDRPVVLCFTADEEAGGLKGAHVLVQEHRDVFE